MKQFLGPSHKDTPYSVTEKGGLWNWHVYYRKILGDFPWNGWAMSERGAERDARAAIDQMQAETASTS